MKISKIQISFLLNWVFTLESYLLGFIHILIGYCLNSYEGKRTFHLYFLCNISYFNWVFNNSFAFC